MGKNIHNVLMLCDATEKILLGAGFILDFTSNRSESKYYRLPDRKELLRVSAHKYTGLRAWRETKLVAKITFTPDNPQQNPKTLRKTNEGIQHMVHRAIGQYFLLSGGFNPNKEYSDAETNA